MCAGALIGAHKSGDTGWEVVLAPRLETHEVCPKTAGLTFPWSR